MLPKRIFIWIITVSDSNLWKAIFSTCRTLLPDIRDHSDKRRTLKRRLSANTTCTGPCDICGSHSGTDHVHSSRLWRRAYWYIGNVWNESVACIFKVVKKELKLPWMWKHQAPPKRWHLYTNPHGVIYQTTTSFIAMFSFFCTLFFITFITCFSLSFLLSCFFS